MPCISFSESDLNLYTNVEFCEGKDHKDFKSTLIYNVKQFMLIFSPRKVYILEDGASGVQVGDIEQVIV